MRWNVLEELDTFIAESPQWSENQTDVQNILYSCKQVNESIFDIPQGSIFGSIMFISDVNDIAASYLHYLGMYVCSRDATYSCKTQVDNRVMLVGNVKTETIGDSRYVT